MFNLKSGNFSGHETFPFRYGWLKKGVDSVLEDPLIFTKDDALITLGVGKNMVLSIRHWCFAANLIAKKDDSKDLMVTDIGKQIFGSNGCDPYIEDPQTLWLLHWLIASNYSKATSWYYLFSFWNQPEFNKELLIKTMLTKLKDAGVKNVAEATIRRDIECLVRTYVPSRVNSGKLLEDSFDCPLSDLDLIIENGNKTYSIHRGDHFSLSNGLFAYFVIDFWSKYYPDRKSLTFEELAYRPGSPGRLVRFDERSFASRLESIEDITSGCLLYDETSGLKQIYKSKEIESFEFLCQCY